MTRAIAAILCAATLSLGSILPSHAEEAAAPKSDSAAQSKPASDSAEKSASDTGSKPGSKTKPESKKSSGSKTKSEPGEEAKPKAEKKKAAADKGMAQMPTRLVSFAAGVFVGIPVSIARKSVQETVNATRDLVGDTDNPLFLGAAGILGVPAGVLSGTFQGVFFGIKNAWTGSGDEPFGKDSFSLGDM